MDPGDDRWTGLTAAVDRAMAAAGLAVGVERFEVLTGGASRETFRFDAGGAAFVLQRERTDTLRHPGGMAVEADVVKRAHDAGVAVPEVVLSNADLERPDSELGASFFITRSVAGETIPRRILRNDEFAGARAALPSQLGAALARIHQTAAPASIGEEDQLEKYRLVADELGLDRPAFEVAFRWLARHRPKAATPRLVHGDFRLGNLIVDQNGLAAVIDWELAHIGDPMEDLGWLCLRAWRFGGPKPVAGIGRYRELFDAYESAGGGTVDAERVRWWETLAALKWGIMCALQASVHRSGAYRSVELLAVGRRIAEQEFDVLELIDTSERGVGDGC